jgi:hypothetical protein
MSAVQLIAPSDIVADGLPALIADAEDRAALRFLEFFTVNFRNPNARAANAWADGVFLRWCEGQGVTFSRYDASYAQNRVRRRARQKPEPRAA